MHADTNRAERRAIQFQRIGYVVYCGRAEDQTNLILKAGFYDLLEVGTLWNNLAHHARIGMKQRLAIHVDDRYVVDKPPISGIGLEQVIKGNVGLHVIRQGAAHGGRVAGIDGCAAEVGHSVGCGIGQLMSQTGCRLVRIGDA